MTTRQLLELDPHWLVRDGQRVGFMSRSPKDRQWFQIVAAVPLPSRREGPESEAVLALLDEPWFVSIKGNHEALMEEAFAGNSSVHMGNGGGWFALLSGERRAELVTKVKDLPVALTVRSPSGRKIGFVHADVPIADWDAFMAALPTPQVQDTAMWSRGTIQRRKRGESVEPIAGVDQVFLGHTPIADPIDAANMRFIDTGCFATGRLTLEEVL